MTFIPVLLTIFIVMISVKWCIRTLVTKGHYGLFFLGKWRCLRKKKKKDDTWRLQHRSHLKTINFNIIWKLKGILKREAAYCLILGVLKSPCVETFHVTLFESNLSILCTLCQISKVNILCAAYTFSIVFIKEMNVMINIGEVAIIFIDLANSKKKKKMSST